MQMEEAHKNEGAEEDSRETPDERGEQQDEQQAQEQPRKARPEPRQVGRGFGSSFKKASSTPPKKTKKQKVKAGQGLSRKQKPQPPSTRRRLLGPFSYKWILAAALVIWLIYAIVMTYIRYQNGTLV